MGVGLCVICMCGLYGGGVSCRRSVFSSCCTPLGGAAVLPLSDLKFNLVM